ncbi:MAG TPA: hypothetical protein VFY84_19360 [Jiangellales bacterium]|nr:hypothetical protein [Jiangellales bacterium]
MRLATRDGRTRLTAHTAVLYFCFQRAGTDDPARITVTTQGCVTGASPTTVDVPGAAHEWEAVPIEITICDEGTGVVSATYNYLHRAQFPPLAGAAVDVTASSDGVLIEEPRLR